MEGPSSLIANSGLFVFLFGLGLFYGTIRFSKEVEDRLSDQAKDRIAN